MFPFAQQAIPHFKHCTHRFGSVLLIAFLAGGIFGLRPVAAEDLRTWSDSTGKFKIKAKFLSLEKGIVTLEKEDGTEMEIDLKKLGAADQKFATDAAKAGSDNPFKPADNDPFKSKTKGGKPAPSSGAGAKGAASGQAANGQTKLIKVNWSSAGRIMLSPPKGGWKVAVPAPAESGEAELTAAPLPNKTSFFEGLKGFAVNRQAKKAAAGYVLTHGNPAGTTRVLICDLSHGQAVETASLPGQMVPLALHDDGEQILMRRDEWGFENHDRLEIWTLDGGDVQRKFAWVPYESVRGPGRDVSWGEFIDEGRLVTCSSAGVVVVWKFPEIRPMFTFNLGHGAVLTLSPDRKLLAYCNGSAVGLFDLTKKAVVAHQATPEQMHAPSIAFSPTGKRLACGTLGKILVWDTASGKLEHTISTDGPFVETGVEFPDDNFLLVSGKYLYEIENQLKLWTYDGSERVRSVGGWTLFAVTNGDKQPGAVVPLQIPHPAARDMMEKVKTDPDAFVVKPGTVVRINLAGVPDVGRRATIEAALTKRLQAIECSAGPTGTIELVATVDGPKSKEVSYMFAGKHKVNEYWARLSFVYEGQPAWQTARTNVPHVITLKEGENIEGYLRDHDKPEYVLYEQVHLPKYVIKPAGSKNTSSSLTLGTSKVTESGLQ